MKIRIAPVLMSFLSLFGQSCELPQSGSEWTVMSWNVQNLFDGIPDGGEYPDFDPDLGIWNDRLYKRRLDRVGEVTSAAVGGSPDLVIFQELEKPGTLEELAAGSLKQSGYHWRLAVPGFGIVRCGVLSRFPLRNVQVVDCGTYGDRSLRPALAFTVDSPVGSVRVVALHWKSPWNGRAATESARRSEARAVLKMVAGNLMNESGLPVLIIGDLNTPGDGGIEPAALAPWEPGIDAATSVIFRTPEAEGTGIQNGIPVFFDPEPDTSLGSPGTYWYRNQWDRPDRALLSREFVDGKDMEFLSCRAGGIPLMEDSQGRPVPWVSEWEDGYSDHLPLTLRFTSPGGPISK